MDVSESLTLIQGYFDALAKGDLARLGELFADDIVWHQPGAGAVSGTYRGKEQVFALFGKFMEISGGTFQIDKLHGHQFPGWGSLLFRTPEFAFLGHRFWDLLASSVARLDVLLVASASLRQTHLVVPRPRSAVWIAAAGAISPQGRRP